MTEEQDEKLRKWKYKDSKEEQGIKTKYDSLCRCLFGEGVQVPENHRFNYFTLEHTINKVSSDRGQKNLAYVNQHQSTARLETSPGYRQQPSFQVPLSPKPMTQGPDPLLLDDDLRPYHTDWGMPNTVYTNDSAYYSNEPQNAAAQGSSGAYQHVPDPNESWSHPNPSWDVSKVGAFSEDDPHPHPTSMDFELEDPNWGFEGSDDPSG
ncbi:hypothetical protein F5Y19DRAFT_223278 [Xylariaceae sp. FL1651]|nr:hypothetical protein F5Y19DRAFT_223278 [Xylariaceae sp. FL1651]